MSRASRTLGKLAATAGVATALAIAAAGCSTSAAPEAAGPAPPRGGDRPATKVVVVKPARGPIRRASEQPGQVEPVATAPLAARLGGYVRTVAVDIGDRVEAGQALAVLDVPEVEADAQQKRAEVDQARAALRQGEAAVRLAEAGRASAESSKAEVEAGVRRAEADLARWRSEAGRARELAAQRAVTGSLVDEATSKLAAAEAARDEATAKLRSADATIAQAGAAVEKAAADRDAAGAGVAVAEAEARRAEALLGYATIAAPFAGVVTRRSVDPGHLTVAVGGPPLFELARVDRVTVVVGVPEAIAPFVGPGDRAEIRLPALGGRLVEGTVARTANRLDEATRTLRTEVDLPNAEGLLLPGLYALVTIVAEEHPEALSVPAKAVVREAGEAFVVVADGGKARRAAVTTGLEEEGKVEIVAGLDGNEAVVESGAASIADGQPVVAAEAPRPDAPKAR